jgi:membrane protein EpsK
MATEVTTKRTGLNIASQWVLNTTNIVVNFFLIAYVIGKVGTEYYGGWTSIVSIIGYLSMLDAGLSVAIQHYVARFSACGEKNKLISLFSSAYVVYGFSAVVAALLCFGISLVYPIIFPKVPIKAAAECVVSLRWVSAAMLIFVLNLPVRGALLGLQRHYMRNTIEFLSLLVRAGMVVISFSMLGPSLAHLGMAFLGAALVRFVLSRVALRLIEPDLRFHLSSVTWSSLRDIFSYGGHTIFWTIATVLIHNSGPILANLILNPSAATYLYVGSQLVRAIGTFVSSASQVFIPVASFLQAAAEKIRLRSALIRGTRFCALVSFSGAAGLIIFGRAALTHWVGFSDNTSYFVVVITTLGWLGYWVFSMAQAMLVGMRVLWAITWINVFRAVFTIILGAVLAYYWGVLGLAAGLVLPLFLSTCTVVPYIACKYTETRLGQLLKESLRGPLLVGAVVAAVSWAFQYVWVPTSIWAFVAQCMSVVLLFGGLSVWKGLDAASRYIILRRIGISVLKPESKSA